MNRTEFHPPALLTSLFVFAVAMGFLEAVVVVYLRELFYPEGFSFPLKPMPEWLAFTETVRELCTILMLMAVAFLTGKSFLRRLASFLFLFGIWDIFYYVALKIFIGWPEGGFESLLTWDILFLIPVIWTGPVLAPVICSLIMIILAVLFEWLYNKTGLRKPGWKALLLFATGSLVIVVAFIFDFTRIIIRGNYFSQLTSITENPEFLTEMTTYVPERFQWEIFIAGLIIVLTGIFPLLKKST